jgi:hypothetical protein
MDRIRLRSDPSLQISAGYANFFDLGPAVAADLKWRSGYAGFGLRAFFGGSPFTQIESTSGIYIPIRIYNKVALTPYGDLGVGLQFRSGPEIGVGVSGQGGLLFTTAAVPGLFLQTAYQYNAYFFVFTSDSIRSNHVFSISLGYGF